MKKEHLLFAAIIGILVAFGAMKVLRKKSQRAARNPPSTEQASPTIQDKSTVLQENSQGPNLRPAPQTVKSLIAEQQISADRLSSGLVAKPLTIESGVTHLKVKLQLQRRCVMGDFDIIRQYGEAENLLLTLEPLFRDEASFDLEAHHVSLEALRSGDEIVYHLPNKKEPTRLGLFLCADSNHSSSCASKKPADFKAILSNATQAKLPQNPLANTILFFQYVEVDGDTLSFFPDSKNLGDTAMKNYDSYASKRFGNAANTSKTKRLKELNTAINSVPLVVEKNTITISLPAATPELCGR